MRQKDQTVFSVRPHHAMRLNRMWSQQKELHHETGAKMKQTHIESSITNHDTTISDTIKHLNVFHKQVSDRVTQIISGFLVITEWRGAFIVSLPRAPLSP